MRSRAGCSDDRGQATVELALALPVVCMFALGIVQLAVVIRDQLAVGLAAREAARAAAVSGTPGASAVGAANAATDLSVDVAVVESAGTVTATVRHTTHTDLPLIGPLLPDVTVSASVTMAIEPP